MVTKGKKRVFFRLLAVTFAVIGLPKNEETNCRFKSYRNVSVISYFRFSSINILISAGGH